MSTLNYLEALTKEFGRLMRQFRDLICSKFETVELPNEVRARAHKRQHEQSKAPLRRKKPAASSESSSQNVRKTLNLAIPKFHALGDYVRTIRMFGCTDSYSTQLVW